MRTAIVMTVLAVAMAPAAHAQYNRGYREGGSDAQRVRCEADDGNTQRCAMNTAGGVAIVRHLSQTACVEGRNWGVVNGGVWVSQGCRAEFASVQGNGYAAPYGGGYGYDDGYGRQRADGNTAEVFTCESRRGAQEYCNARVGWRQVQVIQQLSQSACVEGRSWGQDRRGVWVSNGCRARFGVVGHGGGRYGGGGYDNRYGGGYGQREFSCDSNGNRQTNCAADITRGVRLIRQRSSSPCIQGRTWGVQPGSVWVRKGCRADFALGN